MTCLGFVLGAMSTDYYPRLSAISQDPVATCRLVNEQTEIALLLCGPAVLGMLALAPWVILALYSSEFTPAVEILRWQLLGDILKVMSWPLGFVLLASGAGSMFLITQTVGYGFYLGVVLFGLSLIGIVVTGTAYLVMYLIYLPMMWGLLRLRIGFQWSRAVAVQALALGTAAAIIALASKISETAAAAIGVPVAAVFAFHALGRLAQIADVQGPIGRLAALSRQILAWRSNIV